MKVSIKDKVRHYLNPLHVFCSLNYILSKEKALRAARAYERGIYKPFVTSIF